MILRYSLTSSDRLIADDRTAHISVHLCVGAKLLIQELAAFTANENASWIFPS